MKILAVDTAEQSCSVALVEDNVPICETFHLSRMTHSRTLMDMIVNMVENMAGITIHDVDGFAVASGPGSFTGLRIGISVVKGLAFATLKPSAGISSLDGIAYQFLFSSVPVCVMMDAKRGEVYCAVYLFSDGRLTQKSDEFVVSPEQAVSIVDNTNQPHTNRTPQIYTQFQTNNKCLFAGSGAVAFRTLIQDIMGDKALFAPQFQNSVRASALAHVVFEDTTRLSLANGAIVPVYLRLSDAEMNYRRHNQ